HVAERIEIPKYFTHLQNCDSLFQPPSLHILIDKFSDKNNSENDSDWNKYIDYFKFNGIFKSNSRFDYLKNLEIFNIIDSNVPSKSYSKVYADIIESIIGTFYVHNNFESTEKLIYDLKILSDSDNSCVCGECFINQPNYNSLENKTINKNRDELVSLKKTKMSTSIFNIIRGITNESSEENKNSINYKIDPKFFESLNIIPDKEIKTIEIILNYKFKHKGLLERALVHPSFKDSLSEYFQKLELLGDSIYDFLVTERIFYKFTELKPCDLHVKRMELVCNKTFGKALIYLGIMKHVRINLEIIQDNCLKKVIDNCNEDSLNSYFSIVDKNIPIIKNNDQDVNYQLDENTLIENFDDSNIINSLTLNYKNLSNEKNQNDDEHSKNLGSSSENICNENVDIKHKNKIDKKINSSTESKSKNKRVKRVRSNKNDSKLKNKQNNNESGNHNDELFINSVDRLNHELKNSNFKLSKVFGDIFEAICGAILIDCNFDINVLKKFFSKVIDVIQECKTEFEIV
ncbi:Endoribonuclease Dicer like protein 4, partial [Dictyocoela muelleri]